MAQFKNNNSRADGEFTTSITPLRNGLYGARVMKAGKVIEEDNTAHNRQEARAKLRELLRWVDKLGHTSQMASNSRMRQKK